MKPLIFSLLFFGLIQCNPPSSTALETPLVIAYYSVNGIDIKQYDLKGVDQLIYSFLHLKGNQLAIDNPQDSLTLLQLTALKKAYPKLQVLVSLGGWGGCKTCSDVFSTQAARKEFALSTAQILKNYQADGIDLDWEYPVVPGPPGHPYKDADQVNFTDLVVQLRKELPKKAVLSFAAGGYPDYLERAIDWKAVMPLVDHVNVMSYDMVGGFSTTTGHHTPLYATSQQERSADQAIQWLLEKGVPAHKIVIGAAFYGRIFQQVPPENQGLYQTGTFLKGVDKKNFDEVTQNFTFYWDQIAQAPYAYDEENQLFLTYDNVKSIALKVDYVRTHHLKGIMFWELSNDLPKNGLLHGLVQKAKK